MKDNPAILNQNAQKCYEDSLQQKHRDAAPASLDRSAVRQVTQVTQHAAISDDALFYRLKPLVNSVRADEGEDVVQDRSESLLIKDGDVVACRRTMILRQYVKLLDRISLHQPRP